MQLKNKMILFVCITAILSAVYVFFTTGYTLSDYILEKRTVKLIAILVVSSCIAFSSLLFQTITANKILTPAIMGFESVYLFIQTVIVFMYGDKTFQVLTGNENFGISIFFMMLFSLGIYFLIFKQEKNNIYFLLLVGLILGTLLSSLSSFMQLVIDPDEFSIVENKMFASFNKVNTNLLALAIVVAVLGFGWGFRKIKQLDAIALGKDIAINLGVNYNSVVRKYLFIIAILVSVSTALVGPMTFLGILVTNLTYELFKTYKHSILIPACCLVSCITVLIGQFLVEHLFNFSTTISIIINFIGGVYFIYLLLKMNKK